MCVKYFLDFYLSVFNKKKISPSNIKLPFFKIN